MDKVYTVSDLASKIGVSKALIRKWCRNNRIDFVKKDNGRIYFDEETFKTITSWYSKNKPKKGRKRKINRNRFSISEAARICHINNGELRDLIIENKVSYTKKKSGVYYFTLSQLADLEKYIKTKKNILYSAAEVAKMFNLKSDILRLIAKLDRISCIKKESGRILFTEEHIKEFEEQLNSGFPLLDQSEISEYIKNKKKYYKKWYQTNKEEVQRRRKNKKIKKHENEEN